MKINPRFRVNYAYSICISGYLLRFIVTQSATAEFKLPLVIVRPECAGILRDIPMDEPKLSPASHSVSPYFMEDSNPDKFIKKGEIVRKNRPSASGTRKRRVPYRLSINYYLFL